jgi:hypothetical protein
MTTTAATGIGVVARNTDPAWGRTAPAWGGTRVVRIPDSPAEARLSAGRWLDPARTALMVAVSGSVLAASLLIASLSAGAVGERAQMTGTQPQPAPPPTLITAVP